HKPAITLRSETCAALAGCGRDTSEISLTIDMGGGTTDIGLIIPDKDKPTDLTKLKYYMASLRYAGTHLLNAIVEYDHLKKPIESKDALFLEWKLKLRAGGDIKLGENKSAYDRITCAFFEGLFEYVFNMLIAFKKFLPADKEVKVYLLGNGFKLAQVFCGVGGIQKEEEKVFFNNIVAKAQKSDLLDANIKIALQQPQDQDKKQALINGVFKIREGSDTGMQYTYIETKGHGTKPLILPCLMVSDQSSNQPYLVQEDKYEEFNKALLDKNVSTTDDWQQRKKAFKLTSYYWEHQNVTRNNLFNQAVIKEHATDFGKFYLEHGYVTEVLYKLVTEQKAPVQEQVRKVEPEVTNTPHQQSGFNPNAVSESMAVPPVQTVPPPQSPNNSASIVTLSSGANTLINGDNITVTLNWQSPFKLDVIAFALNDKGKVTADENTIFYNQLNYAQGAVQLNEAQRQLNIVLSKIPSDIKTIAICAVTGIDDESAKGKNFGQVSHSAINVLASNKIIFELNHVKGTETAMIFGEVYRHKDTWKFRAKGQGYAGGFKKMCDEYGAEY
ncbi:MAG TPA: TerD family protein, partial [Agitococcus sp.]|nr:TerD family protein [Agitococcus sp.]